MEKIVNLIVRHESGKIKILSDMEIEDHEIVINIEEKEIKNIKSFFEKLLIESFIKEENMTIKISDGDIEIIKSNTNDDVFKLLNDLIEKFNQVIINVGDE